MNKGTKLFFIILIFLSACLSVAWADGSALGIDYFLKRYICCTGGFEYYRIGAI